MNFEIKIKLEKFLYSKFRTIYYETLRDKSKLDLDYIKCKGFEKLDVQHCLWGNGYDFFNNNACHCFLHFRGKNKQKHVSIMVDGIASYGWYGSVGMLYRCMDEIDGIANELRELRNNLEKQEKIDVIAKNSIKTWLKSIFQNQPYSYYTTESENKITLSIKLKHRTQLDIPIYYKRFQKIMPELLNTIQQFEEGVNKGKIKVLITNTGLHQEWETSKSK